jgi:hypothetical protein
MITDPGMPPSWTKANIRQLGDTADELAQRTEMFWHCIRSDTAKEAYRAAVAVSVAVHGLKPTRWSIWFHGTDPVFIRELSLENLSRVFKADGIAWAREKAEALAVALEVGQ